MRKVAVALSVVGLLAAAGPAMAQSDVAYVQSVNGRVIAYAQGKPALLDAFDIITDQTRLDLQAGSNMEICHYASQRLLALKGPSRLSVTAAALDGDAAHATYAGSCSPPVVSRMQGGLLARGALLKTMEVPLEPVVKIDNKSSVPVTRVTVTDSDQDTVMTFHPRAVRPVLEEGRSYVMGVERADGSELKLLLKGNAASSTAPVIVVIQ